MSITIVLLLFYGGSSFLGMLLYAIVCYDRVIVYCMRLCNIRIYPEAVGIALLIYQHPDEWKPGTHRMFHPKIGDIWTANEAHGLHIETDVGKWVPNKIERRIIRDAVDWRIKTYVKMRIAYAMDTKLVSGRVTDV